MNRSALLFASGAGRIKVVKVLLDAGADVNLTSYVRLCVCTCFCVYIWIYLCLMCTHPCLHSDYNLHLNTLNHAASQSQVVFLFAFKLTFLSLAQLKYKICFTEVA